MFGKFLDSPTQLREKDVSRLRDGRAVPTATAGQSSQDLAFQVSQNPTCPHLLILRHEECGDTARVHPLVQKRPVGVEHLDPRRLRVGRHEAREFLGGEVL